MPLKRRATHQLKVLAKEMHSDSLVVELRCAESDGDRALADTLRLISTSSPFPPFNIQATLERCQAAALAKSQDNSQVYSYLYRTSTLVSIWSQRLTAAAYNDELLFRAESTPVLSGCHPRWVAGSVKPS
jgi:hypothetical protein